MSLALLLNVALLAQEAAPGPPAILQMLPMLASLGLLYFFMIHRPYKREQAARESMISNIKKNDRVLTTSGIYGVVTNVQSATNEVTVRVDETSNTKLRMTMGSIARILGDESSDAKDSA